MLCLAHGWKKIIQDAIKILEKKSREKRLNFHVLFGSRLEPSCVHPYPLPFAPLLLLLRPPPCLPHTGGKAEEGSQAALWNQEQESQLRFWWIAVCWSGKEELEVHWVRAGTVLCTLITRCSALGEGRRRGLRNPFFGGSAYLRKCKCLTCGDERGRRRNMSSPLLYYSFSMHNFVSFHFSTKSPIFLLFKRLELVIVSNNIFKSFLKLSFAFSRSEKHRLERE